MKYAMLLLCALFLGGTLGAFDFAKDGKPLCVIVVSGQPNELEKMAADDLKEFLGKMTGAQFRIVPEKDAPDTPAVYLGQTAFAAKNKIDFGKLGAEEWVIRSAGKNLIVSGGRPVGSFYGVWALLKKLGCYPLTMDQTVIPSRKTLSISNPDEQKKPAFEGRLIFNDFPGKAMIAGMPKNEETAYNLWSLRSGMNGLQTHRIKSCYIGGIYNISHTPPAHTLSVYVNPDQYFKTHPEYFSMDANGKRFRPTGLLNTKFGSLCMSNPEVWKITLNSLREMIRKDRKERPKENWPYLYDISILDASPFVCKCPVCSAISKEEGSECGLLLRYINYVATEIAKEYPEIVIRTFAYSAVRQQPKITKPAKNVLLQLCDEFPQADAYRPLTSDFNKERLTDLRKWQALGANLMIWDYWNIGNEYFNPPRVEVLIDAIQPDLKLFRELGAKALFLEAERDFVSPQNFIDLEYFIATELMMNPDQDVEKLIDVFMNGFYGPAAPVMKEWLNELRAGIRAHPKKQTILTAGNWNFITDKFAVDSYLKLKKTAEKLPGDSVYRRRVEDEMITPMWAFLVKRVAFEPAFKKAGINMDDMVRDCKKYVYNHIRRYGARNPAFIDKMFNDKFTPVTVNLPRPEKFKEVADENIRVLGYPQATPIKHLNSAVVDDPDSITGKALKSPGKDDSWHGVNARIDATPTVKVPAMKFELGNIGAPGAANTILRQVPQDEKYHWYKLNGKIDLREKSYFWGHSWAIQFNTTSIYVLSDGIADNNVWECWFNAKFTGPAYAPGSKKENAVYVDMVVLTRPGSMK